MGDRVRRTRFEEGRAVRALVDLMLAKLRANRHKPHWSKEDIKDLLFMLQREVDELETALQDINFYGEDVAPAIAECADVANFAAMIADNLRARKG